MVKYVTTKGDQVCQEAQQVKITVNQTKELWYKELNILQSSKYRKYFVRIY